jgi:8-oxo-dGTP pyrophosphatase MutT (NUDIX family)
MQELFVLVAKRSPHAPLEICGCVTRDAAHALGFPHTSAILAPVTWDESLVEPVILLHKRSPYKRTCPDTWDFCGGHLTFETSYLDLLERALDSQQLLERASLDTAVREANEELQCEPPFQFRSRHVHRFQAVGYFACETQGQRGKNVEFSTVYVVAVPGDRSVTVWDTDAKGERQLEVRRFTWPELLERYRDEPGTFADGAGRVLKKLSQDAKLNAEFERLVKDASATFINPP